MFFSMDIKRIIAPPLVLALLISGCAKKEDVEEDIIAPAATASPTALADALDFSATQNEGRGAGLIVDDTVAYIFTDTLYGGFTYTNKGSTPLVLTEATLNFTLTTGAHTEIYTPFSGVDDIVLPGETACAALFAPIGGGEVLSLSVNLKYDQAGGANHRLEVSHEKLITNYPGFATLSGRLTNASEEEVSLCFVYVMLYDKDSDLIGVWYFPRNAVLQPSQGSAFVVHLRSLPVEGLSERTSSMRFRAFGLG